MGKFSPIGRLFWKWFENIRSSANFWATFWHNGIYVLIFWQKMVLQHFGRPFHKLIWSPCLYVNKSSFAKFLFSMLFAVADNEELLKFI
jgi:hypothetical protein